MSTLSSCIVVGATTVQCTVHVTIRVPSNMLKCMHVLFEYYSNSRSSTSSQSLTWAKLCDTMMLQLPGVEFKRSGPDQTGYCRLRRDLEASPSKDLARARALNVVIPAVFRSYGPKNGAAQKRRPRSTRQVARKSRRTIGGHSTALSHL